MRLRVRAARRLDGIADIPGDKSVSHRAALLGALAQGRTEITGFLEAEDCGCTLRAVQALGASVARKAPGHYLVDGVGLYGLTEPDDVIDCGNSGTTARLLLGVLAGQPFCTVLTGDDSLRRRPMARVAEPLRRMGATLDGRDEGRRLPLLARGARPLHGLEYRSPVASAQVKSALLLAGLWADGPVTVDEPAPSRDHTERMLGGFGVRVRRDGTRVTLDPGQALAGQGIAVPGDISSAAFLLAAAAGLAQARVTLRHVGVNPTRAGFLEALAAMGARVARDEERGEGGEPVADLTVTSGTLRGVDIAGDTIPRLIDEVPALAVLACVAEGITRVRDAAELRVKESDRIHAIAVQLGALGAHVVERSDGIEVHGGRRLRGATVSSGGDHRMAMALAVAGLLADGVTVVEDTACIATSFPGFVDTVNRLAGEPCVVMEP